MSDPIDEFNLKQMEKDAIITQYYDFYKGGVSILEQAVEDENKLKNEISELREQLNKAETMSECIKDALISNLSGDQGSSEFGYRGYGQPRHSLVQRKKPKARRGRGRGRRM